MEKAKKTIRLRGSIEFAKNYFKENVNTIVEVGVESGRHAIVMYKALLPKLFYLVDPYKQPESRNNYELAMISMKDAQNYKFIVKPSHLAINDVPNELDLVYIDANHDYDNVKRDIACWYPKVRKGGIMCGHDYRINGVYTAVKEVFPIINLSTPNELRVGWGVEDDPDPYDDWWIVK